MMVIIASILQLYIFQKLNLYKDSIESSIGKKSYPILPGFIIAGRFATADVTLVCKGSARVSFFR